MHYYYDVLANLEIDLWDFYEWEETDAILPIKKVPLVRVTESDIKSFFKYNVVFDQEWIQKYLEKTIVKNSKEKLSCILFSSTKNCILLEVDGCGRTISRSRLLMEDENNCNEVAFAIKPSSVLYKIESKLKQRQELRQITAEKHLIEVELNTLRENKNQIKCSYLYYEWFGSLESNFEKMLEDMTEELKKETFAKFHQIAKIIKMSYKERL